MLLSIAASPCALAQLKPPAPAPPAASTAQASSLDDQIAAVQRRVQALKPRLTEMAETTAYTPLPPEIKPDEWTEQRRLVHTAEISLRNHLDILQKLKAVRRSMEEAKAASDNWRQFARAPPNALEFVDDLWTRASAKKREIEALRNEQSLAEGQLGEARTALETSRRQLREATEQLERASSAERVARSRWLASLADARVQRAESWLSMLESERALKAETLAWRSSELTLLQRMATAATKAYPFSEQERDARLSALDERARELDQHLERATTADGAARKRLDAAVAALKQARDATPQDAAAVARLQQVYDTRKAAADTTAMTVHLLQLFRQTIPLRQQMWRQRYDLQRDNDPAHMRKAMADISRDLGRLAPWRAYLQSELANVRALVDELELQLSNWRPDLGDKAVAQEKLQTYTQREALLRRLSTGVEEIEAVLVNWRETLVLRNAEVTPTERARDYAGIVADLGRSLWNLELLTVEDKIVVEGREIVGKRSVTVSKVVEVLLILLLGLWITGKIAARGRRIAMARLAGRESTALLVHRVLSLTLSVCLIVAALVTASIPLAAFAFLGGALAIGVGFGAQNLLNNFISGLILLIEKPIKLGDVVDVEGVRGTVTDIGTRCSKVRRADGVDMLIPNSSFLQQTVTNWTHSDQQSRFTIRVGAGYGSPTREVEALMLRAMAEHPEVLQDPPPQVLFEDFGDNALAFTGNFWMNLRRHPRSGAVMSDIRYRIDELFREHGISIPFPQRDLHVDTAAPLQVEVALKPVTRDERADALEELVTPVVVGTQR